MEIVAFDTDDRADGQGKAKITWISKGLLNTAHVMNSTRTSAGGWESSEMRAYLKNTIKPLIPETVRNAIVPVTKVQCIYNGSVIKDGQTTTEDVWIPGHREIFNTTDRETGGAVYSGKFTNSASRIKSKNGSSTEWWLRSSHVATGFGATSNIGTGTSLFSERGSNIALGFCT